MLVFCDGHGENCVCNACRRGWGVSTDFRLLFMEIHPSVSHIRMSCLSSHSCTCRGRTFFDLGLNVARLFSLPAGVPVVRATAQLFAEFDYYCSKDGGMQDLVRGRLWAVGWSVTDCCDDVENRPDHINVCVPQHRIRCTIGVECNLDYSFSIR